MTADEGPGSGTAAETGSGARSQAGSGDGSTTRRIGPGAAVALVLAFLLVVGLVSWWVARSGASDGAVEPAPTGDVSASAEPTASEDPSDEPSDEPTDEPTDEPSEEPTGEATPSAVPTADPGDPGLVTLPPVDLEVPVDQDALTVGVGALESVDGVGQGVGEVSGPAVRVPVTITNRGDQAFSTAQVVVSFTYGADQVPAVELSGPGVARLSGDVAAGGSATGTYVFAVPTGSRAAVQVNVQVGAGAPIIAFSGPAPA